jgi:hypothetical protein
MKKSLSPLGAKINLSELLSLIQERAFENLFDLKKNIFSHYGVLISGVEDSSLEITQHSPTQVIVAPGRGLCETGHLIEVPLSTPTGERTLTINDGYDGPIYIKHVHQTDSPIEILDGFVFNPSGSELTSDSNQFDSFTLTTTDPGVSGIELANAARSGSSISITDNRINNKLALNYAILGEDAQAKIHDQNTDTGTDSLDFYIGIGTYAGGTGFPVVYTDDDFAAPLNVRVESAIVLVPSSYNTYSSSLPFAIRTGIATPEVVVQFAWGHRIKGTGDLSGGSGPGGKSTFLITSYRTTTGDSFKTFSQDELAGYYFYDTSQNNYKILSNSATDGSNHTEIVLDTSNSIPNATSEFSTLHSNADEYAWELIPVDPDNGDAELEPFTEQGTINMPYAANGPTKQSFSKVLNLGWKYTLRVSSKRKSASSSASTLEAGDYIYNSNTYSYTVPYYALPGQRYVDMSDASITASATEYGFVLTIVGMDGTPSNPLAATDFEIVYAADGNIPDFASDTNPHIITGERRVEISSAASTEYNIKVRPLVGGFVALDSGVDPVSTSVISGGGGVLPTDLVIGPKPIYFKSYGNGSASPDTGIISGAGASKDPDWGYTISSLDLTTYPIDVSSASGIYRKAFIAGGSGLWYSSAVYDNGNDTAKIRLHQEGGGNDTDLATIVSNGFYLGDTYTQGPLGESNWAGYWPPRRILKNVFQSNVKIVAAALSIETTSATETVPAVIRFYQENLPAQAKTVEITGPSSDVQWANIDLNITQTKGSLRLVVDAWDPSTEGPSNGVNISGEITIYYRNIA